LTEKGHMCGDSATRKRECGTERTERPLDASGGAIAERIKGALAMILSERYGVEIRGRK